MSNTALDYQLPAFMGLLNHSFKKAIAFRDGANNPEVDYKVDIQARSGDYFVTLATELDKLGSTIPDYRTRAAIEEIVSDLIYLQDNYTITKRAHDELAN